MAAEFQKDSIDWQLQQFFRRLGEWIELRFPQFQPPDVPDAPRWQFPSWWLEAAFWVIVSAAALWLGYQAYRWISLYLGPNHPQYAKFLERRQAASEKERSIAGWIREAQEFQRQGNYQEACRALYMAMLQRLNDTKLIPNDFSRTDREYARLVQLLPQADAYRVLLQTHEQLRFGNAAASVDLFNQCQQAYGEIERATATSST
jgi:hypothetical protein